MVNYQQADKSVKSWLFIRHSTWVGLGMLLDLSVPLNIVVSINASQKSFYLLYQEPGPYGMGYPRR